MLKPIISILPSPFISKWLEVYPAKDLEMTGEKFALVIIPDVQLF